MIPTASNVTFPNRSTEPGWSLLMVRGLAWGDSKDELSGWLRQSCEVLLENRTGTTTSEFATSALPEGRVLPDVSLFHTAPREPLRQSLSESLPR